jgi:hypothetical protein
VDIVLVSATPGTETEFINNTPLGYTMIREELDWYEVEIICGNKDGLPKVYNRIIKKCIEDPFRSQRNTMLVFLHDDLSIQDTSWKDKLESSDFDIIGLAGTQAIPQRSPILWNNTPSQYWSGAVAHTDGKDIWMTTYGNFRKQCAIVDGCFIAVKLQKIIEAGIRFDERFDFHFYDIDFCLQCREAGLSIGTEPIWCVHSGLGIWDTPEWHRNEKLFLEKWRQK